MKRDAKNARKVAETYLEIFGPDRFFVPPYVGGRGWLGVRLDVTVDWDDA